MNDGVLLLLLIGGVAWLWYNDRAAYERVYGISATVCQELSVQRLDDSVSLRWFRPRWFHSTILLERRYVFEFTTNGTDRCLGEIALLGSGLEWVRIAHPKGEYFIDRPSGQS